MPRISCFYGITIAMYYRDHGTPHFHAIYGEFEASISIDSLEVLGGRLPIRAHRLVTRWAVLRRDQLGMNWERAQRGEALENIAPLL